MRIFVRAVCVFVQTNSRSFPFSSPPLMVKTRAIGGLLKPEMLPLKMVVRSISSRQQHRSFRRERNLINVCVFFFKKVVKDEARRNLCLPLNDQPFYGEEVLFCSCVSTFVNVTQFR